MNKCKCPIPGCDFEFSYGILGWDSHIARIENHPTYHPKVVTADNRKRVFIREFMAFFDLAKTANRKSDIAPKKHQSGVVVRDNAEVKKTKTG